GWRHGWAGASAPAGARGRWTRIRQGSTPTRAGRPPRSAGWGGGPGRGAGSASPAKAIRLPPREARYPGGPFRHKEPDQMGMRPENLYELTWVADPRLSPDGATVAYVVWSLDREANDYRSAVWMAPVDGSAPPRKVTAGERQDAEPRGSPDGRSLAFTSNRGGEKEKKQLSVMPAPEPGGPRQTTEPGEDCER